MTNTDTNKFYFDRKNYFVRFIPHGNETAQTPSSQINKNISHALEYFVADLRRDRNKTIERFLSEETLDNIFSSIAQLLLNEDNRICGNSAYIIGSAVEFESGLKRFLTIFSQDRTENTVDIIQTLSNLLSHSDSECAMNAAGILGTICGSKEGRNLILNHACISQMITNTSSLLSSENSWIASNAALVLARLTVEELGSQAILTHPKHRQILNEMLAALDVSYPGRATNAAFAIGRLIEGDEGKKIFVAACGQYKIVNEKFS
ncbi:unnamed protein product [Adineta ricciae]|uniref:Uncharacterized protein n=1 Tax=Adineta ricciae TaxID=249248 RepID=A0A816EF55_ADIRI|nr:unnamed protein product [Adineta ricciae]